MNNNQRWEKGVKKSIAKEKKTGFYSKRERMRVWVNGKFIYYKGGK